MVLCRNGKAAGYERPYRKRDNNGSGQDSDRAVHEARASPDAKKHGGINETITVRRISYGVGCEKVFPVHSPTIVSVETVRRGKVRRAKLYYLRDRVGKKAKVKERI